jgi:uncharacterized protein YraI
MRHIFLTALIGCLIIALFPACQQTGEGPRSWIDQPLDNETFPFEVLTLQAHASDLDGVKDIEFLVDDQSVKTINAGGERMGKALYEWMPPAPGVYIIYAQAVDNSGNLGDTASSRITIVDQVAQIPLVEPAQPQIKQDEDEEEDPIQEAVKPVEGPVAVPSQGINCRGGPSMDYDVLTVLPTGKQSKIIGRLSSNSWLFVSHPENFIECWVAASIVDIIGDLNSIPIVQAPSLPVEPPKEEPPVAPQPKEEPIPDKDTNPPVIASVTVSPGTIYQNGCGGEVQTTTLTVKVIDIGGGVHVEAAWVVGNEIGQAELTDKGNYSYQITLGPFSNKGTLSIYGSAIDGSGNWTPFNITAEVVCCIC